VSKPFHKKKRYLLPLLLFVSLVFADIAVVSLTHGKTGEISVSALTNTVEELKADQIKVMTINLAHGRSNGKNQILQSKEVIEENVNKIGQLVARESAQVVVLQEADAPSWWSGRFSHVNRVGEIGGMTSAVQGRNIDGLGLQYGAAVVTQLTVTDARQVTFDMNIPTFSKGFVVVTCVWPDDPDFEFDIISLHLDFASDKVRSYQMSVIQDLIKQSERPVVVMGDFNTDITKELLPKFIDETGLSAWRVDDTSIVTFPFLGTRIDWIFVSPELEIIKQNVLDDVVSDHKVVAATLRKR